MPLLLYLKYSSFLDGQQHRRYHLIYPVISNVAFPVKILLNAGAFIQNNAFTINGGGHLLEATL